MAENKINPSEGLISSNESTQLASIPEENIFNGSAKDDVIIPIPERDAVLAQIEKEKTLALIKAWEESEKAKAVNRAHKKVVEIGSWETTWRASIEDLIKKAEEDTEKKKVEYMEKVRNKIAELHKEAESKRLMISSKRGEDVAKVEDRATKFRSSGGKEKKEKSSQNLSADGVLYHKTCFRCRHCNGRLVISRFCSIEGVLYCKPYYEQLFKETGSFSKRLQQPGKTSGKPNVLPRAPSKLSHLFSGTQDKCAFCNKTAYSQEKLMVEGESYHKSCFRCSHGGCFLTPSTYAALDGILYCKHHFSQLFKQKGSYSHLMKATSAKKFIISPPLGDMPKVEIATAAT